MRPARDGDRRAGGSGRPARTPERTEAPATRATGVEDPAGTAPRRPTRTLVCRRDPPTHRAWPAAGPRAPGRRSSAARTSAPDCTGSVAPVVSLPIPHRRQLVAATGGSFGRGDLRWQRKLAATVPVGHEA